jgi:mevalonate kinase
MRNNLNLQPGGLSHQRPQISSNNTQQHYIEDENKEEEMNLVYMSDTYPEATTNQNTEIISPRKIIQKARKLTEKLQKSMKDHLKVINQKEKRESNMKNCKDHELKHQKNSFKRINSTKTINILINNIAGMGIRTNKLQQIVSYLEEHNFDILRA